MWSAVAARPGCMGTVSVSRDLRLPGGDHRAAQAETGRGVFQFQVDRPVKPSRRRAYTVIGTAAPARALTLDGTTRSAKSGRGGLIRRR